MSKNVFQISEEDYKNLIGKQGLVFMKSLGRSINISWIAEIVPEEQYFKEIREKRAQSDRGVLHDGTSVVRKFGRYYLENDPEARIDSQYYPEVAKDCVPTPDEFENLYRELPQEKRLEAILGITHDNERISQGQGFKRLGDLKK